MANAKELTDRFWQLFESNQFAELEKLIDPDCEFKMPGTELRGPAALRSVLEAYRAAFPDLKHLVKHHVEAGDTIALELEVSGTHTGIMQTPEGAVPATLNRVVWQSCDYIRVSRGKLVSWHAYYDTVPFLTALGLLPGPAR